MARNLRFNLALLRAARGRLTQRQVAEATGLSRRTISELETGASQRIEFSTIAKLCELFECTPNELMVVEEEIEVTALTPQSLQKADEIIALGLKRAMEAPAQSTEDIWAEFDAVRKRNQAQVQTAENHSNKNSTVNKQ